MGAQNFYFAFKFFQNGNLLSALNFALFWKNFLTWKNIVTNWNLWRWAKKYAQPPVSPDTSSTTPLIFLICFCPRRGIRFFFCMARVLTSEKPTRCFLFAALLPKRRRRLQRTAPPRESVVLCAVCRALLVLRVPSIKNLLQSVQCCAVLADHTAVSEVERGLNERRLDLFSQRMTRWSV